MKNIIDCIGNTPLVELKKLSPKPSVRLFAKLEGNNPGGSVKDRAAYSMVKRAMDRGDLRPGMKLVEATSGNTGIALAMMAAIFGLELELVMPENSTRERTLTMQAYGAKVTLLSSIEACRDYAEEKGSKADYYLLNQFANSDNSLAHYETTGPEIWKDTQGQISHFVSAMGTTGTIMGVSRYLKEQNHQVEIVGCQPTEGSAIAGIRRWPSEYLPKIFDAAAIDRTLDVSQNEAIAGARTLAKEAGLFVGMSSGGAFHCAQKLAASLSQGLVVFIACDRGDRYLSSDLFG